MFRSECLSCSIQEIAVSIGQKECFLYFPDNGNQYCGLKMGVTVNLLTDMCTRRMSNLYKINDESTCLEDYQKCNIKSLEQFCVQCIPVHGSFYSESVLKLLSDKDYRRSVITR